MVACSLFFIWFGVIAMADKSNRVLVLPMQIHSDRDLGFLKKGVGDMLNTRLAIEGKVTIVLDGQAYSF